MQPETKTKKTYGITGKTSTGKFVCTGFGDKKFVIEYFIQKYPRFKGYAEIRTQFAQDMGNGMLCADYGRWETIDSFHSTKELKEYTQKGV